MQNQNSGALPWTREQFQQMQTLLNVTIPEQEDNLRRSKAAGLDVDALVNQLAEHKRNLSALIKAWEDKYK